MTTKTDMDRCGLFQEMGYHTIGDKYPKTHVSLQPFNKQAGLGKQLLNDFPKTDNKINSQAAYFDRKFVRIFEKEAYHDYVGSSRRNRVEERKKKIAGEFKPPEGFKDSNGKGMYFGTFSGPVQHFSPETRPRSPYKQRGKNFINNPGKKGTGYGYHGLTIGKPYPYIDDKYDRSKHIYSEERKAGDKKVKSEAFKLNLHPTEYFDRNPFALKKQITESKIRKHIKLSDANVGKVFRYSSPSKNQGGCHAGTFSPFPEYVSEPYKKLGTSVKDSKRDKIPFYPNQHYKSRPYSSILKQNVLKETNRQNYRRRKKAIFA